MKKLVSKLLNVLLVFTILVVIAAVVVPFHLMNLEQAHRIAKWKSEYEELIYSFNLANMYDGKLVPKQTENGKILTEDYLYKNLKPYFNLADDNFSVVSKYRYKQMNGKRVSKSSDFYFDKFMFAKNGAMLSVKRNVGAASEDDALFYMFVDINGTQKPNKIGQDIFFLNIFKDRVSAVGYGKDNINLKTDCSPIGSGIYCSAYYLLGGRF